MRGTGEHRIQMSISTRAVIGGREREVLLVELSAGSARLIGSEPFGELGECIDLYLPGLGTTDVKLLAGIDRLDSLEEGHAATVRFMVPDQPTRLLLNDLLAGLLDGDGGGNRKHPRIFYDVKVTYGPHGAHKASLEQISMSGLAMITDTPMAVGFELTLGIPELGSGPGLAIWGKVVHQRPAPGGGYHTGVTFGALAPEERRLLGQLLADLMCR